MITPLHDFVAITPDVPEAVTDTGIVLVHTKPQGTTMGTVVASGPGIHTDSGFDAMVVQPGDRVIFNKGTGTEVEVTKDMKLLFIRQRDLMGILR